MEIEEMLTPPAVAEFLGESPQNIRITLKNKKKTKFRAIVIGILFLREKVTVREVEEAIVIIKAKREYAKSKRAKKSVSR